MDAKALSCATGRGGEAGEPCLSGESGVSSACRTGGEQEVTRAYRPLTIAEWRASSLPLLDLRPAAEYAAGHLPGATHFDWSTRTEAMQLLPPRGAPLCLLADSEERAREAAAFFSVHYEVRGVVEAWRAGGWSGPGSGLELELELGPRSRRLWRPNALLEREVARVEALVGGPGLALDLACGSGRDATFLCERGWRVLCLDRDERLLRKAAALAGPRADCLLADLEADPPLEPLLSRVRARADLVHVARYLHRPRTCRCASLLVLSARRLTRRSAAAAAAPAASRRLPAVPHLHAWRGALWGASAAAIPAGTWRIHAGLRGPARDRVSRGDDRGRPSSSLRPRSAAGDQFMSALNSSVGLSYKL